MAAQRPRRGSHVERVLTYLAEARARTNLEIQPDTLVDRVIVEAGARRRSTWWWTGTVSVSTGDQITLAAGAVGLTSDPVALGCGTPAVLRALGIPVTADRRGVGDVLLDHPAIGIPGLAADGVRHDNRVVTEIGVRYTAAGSPESNDMQLYLATLFDPTLTRTSGPEPKPMFSIGPALVRPRSSGRLSIVTPDPTRQPVLELNYLADPFDLARIVDALRLARDLARSPHLAGLAGPLLVDDTILDDDHEIAEFVRSQVATTYHPAGTAPMGSIDDERSVVDAHGRVHGIDGLRAVDASIMPTSIRCNTHLTCVMVAERIASWMTDGH